MRTSLRSFSLLLACSFGIGAAAQITVTVTGTVSPCGGVIYPVHIQTNTVPPLDTTIYTDANCQYSFTFYPTPIQGVITASTTCDGGITWVSGTGSWNPFFPPVVIDLACNGGGTCDACFTVTTPQPWTIQYTNCSSGGTPPYAYTWTFNNGATSSLANPTETVSTSGMMITCLQITDADSCTSLECDTIFIGTDGLLDNGVFNCVACIDAIPATNGPAGPLIPWTIDAINCSSGGTAPVSYYYEWSDGSTQPPPRTFNQPGWYQVCIYMADANGCTSVACDSVMIDGDGTVDPVDPGDCTAGFWVMQAYEPDSTNPGTAVPIPNLLWIWNLSTPGNATATLNMSTVAGSSVAIITGCNAALIGATVSGPNIPAGTTITAVNCPSVVLSQNATATGTALHNFTGTTGSVQFVWSWGDGTPDSTDPFPTHFYTSGGPYNLCLTITDISGCTDTACDSISVDGDGMYSGMILDDDVENSSRSGFTVNVLNELPETAINDRPAMENTMVWPNPVEDALNLSFNTSLSGNMPMTIIDMSGRAVLAESVQINAGGNDLRVPTDELAPGMYLLRFGNDAKAVAFRFVKR